VRAVNQRHLEAGVEEVLAGKRVMQQSLFLTPTAADVAAAAAATRPEIVPAALWALPVSVMALVTALAALVAALVR
jgi:hypothetical protein